MMNINPALVILGNGFDLANGYKTRYSDFYKSNDFTSLVKTNRLASYINSQNIDRWADLETCLFHYSQEITRKYGVGNAIQSILFKKNYFELKQALFNYLAKESHNSVEVSASSLIRSLLIEWSKLNPVYLTFNYTIITPCGIFGNNRVYLNTDDSINNNVFIYQHGSIYDTKDAEQNVPGNLVLGIDKEIQRVEDIHSFLYKEEQPVFNIESLQHTIANRNVYIIYGWSFGVSDTKYIKMLFNPDYKGKTYIIYAYDDYSLKGIRGNLNTYITPDFLDKNKVLFILQSDKCIIWKTNKEVSALLDKEGEE